MRKILVHEFISLDGVIQAPGSPTEDTDGGFHALTSSRLLHLDTKRCCTRFVPRTLRIFNAQVP